MIKFLPEIYPNEAAYSYFSRCYAYSGYIWNQGFSKEIFERSTANIDCCFLNVFTPEFKKLIEKKLGFEKLLLDHTLFKYYSRFLPLDKRKKVFQMAINNEVFLSQNLPIPLKVNTSCLRYCPECVKEDRLKYGEAYIHIGHIIPDIHICSKHCCELIDVEFIKQKINNTTFVPLEHSIYDMKVTVYDTENINVKVTQYITEVFEEPLDMNKELIIGNFLSNKLEEKYISPRGEQRNISQLFGDIQNLYSGLKNFDITKNRVAYIYRNLTFNPYEILLVSMFQNISPKVLCAYEGNSYPKHVEFDRLVRDMFQSGLSMNKIGQILNVNHEVVRQVLIGTYDKPTHLCSTYRCEKWDWEKIDNECCSEFFSKVSALDRNQITKKTVAELFGLKDERLRNLPKLNALLREYKERLKKER